MAMLKMSESSMSFVVSPWIKVQFRPPSVVFHGRYPVSYTHLTLPTKA
jgi:hypothetical protein